MKPILALMDGGNLRGAIVVDKVIGRTALVVAFAILNLLLWPTSIVWGTPQASLMLIR